MTISVAVADDQALVRVGFCGIVAATPGLAVVGEAANGAEAVTVARSARPDVLLMDVRMPVLDGIEATRQITSSAESACVRVIILTTFDLDDYVFGALRAGASGFLLKDTLPEDLITAIRVVAAGEALLAPSVTRRLISAFARTPADLGEDVICRVASMPSSTGMRTSISSTSGLADRATATASAPLAASPTTARPGVAATMPQNPTRTRAWSSATATEIVIPGRHRPSPWRR